MNFALGGKVRTEVYIDFSESAEKNKALFDHLQSQKEAIEREFGEPLTWERLDDRRACRIAAYRSGSIEDKPEELNQIRAWAVERLLKLRTVFTARMRDFLDSHG